MRERPILFSAPMVRAILEGRKRVTRRIVKPQPEIGGAFARSLAITGACPYGAPGDRLWVRETWAPADGRHSLVPVVYRADGDDQPCADDRWRPSIHMPRWASRLTLDVVGVRVERLHDISEEDARAEGATSRPRCSGYQSRRDGWSMDWSRVGEFDRLTQRPIVESDISLGTARMAFANLWNAINGAESWDANPWVWVVEFRRVEQEARAA